jgi:hypothetical protein
MFCVTENALQLDRQFKYLPIGPVRVSNALVMQYLYKLREITHMEKFRTRWNRVGTSDPCFYPPPLSSRIFHFRRCNVLMCSEFQVFGNSHSVFPFSALNAFLCNHLFFHLDQIRNIGSSMFFFIQCLFVVRLYVDMSKSNNCYFKQINTL